MEAPFGLISVICEMTGLFNQLRFVVNCPSLDKLEFNSNVPVS